ncbi:MAG: hypothetical protein ABI690_36265 [Chloroflexota bacterium]
MRKLTGFVAVFMVMSLVAAGAFSAVAAQDATAAPASGTTVQCDSDLILNLYIADRFFGFGKVQDQIMTSGTSATPWVDMSTIDKGQFTPWFTGEMAGTNMGAITLNDQQLGTLSSTLMMDDATRQQMMDSAAAGTGTDMTTVTPLAQTMMAGEPAECAQLRTELTSFFNIVAFQDFSGALNTMPGTVGSTDMSGAATAAPGTTDMSGATATP